MSQNEEQAARKRAKPDELAAADTGAQHVYVAWQRSSHEDEIEKELIGIYKTQRAALMALAWLYNQSGRGDEDLPDDFFDEEKTPGQIVAALCDLHKDKWLSHAHFTAVLGDGEYAEYVEEFLLE